MKNKYRIVRDNYNGYEVQVKRWWFPVWLQAGFANTHKTIKQAEYHALVHANTPVKEFKL